MFAQAVNHHLARHSSARLVVQLPVRESYDVERRDFSFQLRLIGLEMLHEETDIGFDDWSEGPDEDLKEVECWLSIWHWAKL